MSVPVSQARHPARPAIVAWRSNVLANTLLAIGAFLLIPAALLVWAEATVFDSDGFADAATRSVEEPAVQDRIAVALADRIVKDDPQLDRARPLIEGAAEGFIQSDRFQEIFRAAVDRMHELVFDENANAFVLDLTAALSEIVERIEAVAPQLAERIPPDLGSGLVEVTESGTRARLIQLAEEVRFLAYVVPVISLVCLGASLWFARNRRSAAFRLGLALAIVAAVTVLALVIGDWLLTDRVAKAENQDAANAIWWAWLQSLRDAMRVLGLAGVVLAAAVWWVAKNGWPWQRRPEQPSAA
jgi:hypothetical protein